MSGLAIGASDGKQLRFTLQSWDKASTSNRKKMLQGFVTHAGGMTGPELEAHFASGASLFLARVSAWFRMTYMNQNSCVAQQLQAISVFVGASSGQRFLVEFIEVGGVLTVLEVLTLQQSTEEDLAAGVALLMAVADAGRKYKELLCESDGIQYIAGCLTKVERHQTRQATRDLLYQLAMGNPKYQQDVVACLVGLLPTAYPGAQIMAAQVLRLTIPMLGGDGLAEVVEPALSLLSSLELQVQYEGCELIKELVKFDEVEQPILQGIIAMLKPTASGGAGAPPLEPASAGADALFYSQQAAAAKTIGVLCTNFPDLTPTVVKLQCIHGLLYAMSNSKYTDSQLQAASSLEIVLSNSFGLMRVVKESIGEDLFYAIMQNRDQAFSRMSQADLDLLAANTFHVDEADDRAQPGGVFFGTAL